MIAKKQKTKKKKQKQPIAATSTPFESEWEDWGAWETATVPQQTAPNPSPTAPNATPPQNAVQPSSCRATMQQSEFYDDLAQLFGATIG